MRILLTHHFPLDFDAAGRFALGLAQGLLAAGHDVRCLVIGEQGPPHDAVATRVINIAAPRFAATDKSQPTFRDLTDAQLDEHRDVLRTAMDAEIDAFNPHVVHAQHIWLLGHLALEMGVPYVVSAWDAELTACRADGRYLRYAQEAAENAGRILISTPHLADDVTKLFGDLDGRVATADSEQAWLADGGAQVIGVYRDVLASRYGEHRSLLP